MMKNLLKNHGLLLFWICLMLSTYIGYSEEVIIVFALVFCIMRKRLNIGFINRNLMFIIFFTYCFFLTLIGSIIGFAEIKSIFKFIVEYVLLVYCVSSCLFFDKTEGILSLLDIRNMICISAIYGTVETILKYNPLTNIVSTINWLNYMNALTYRYQPSSIYLHYTYYAFFLLIGFIILLKFPFKKKLINIGAYILIIEQLFFSKSRMGWITFVLILFFYWVIVNKKGKIKKRYLYSIFILIIVFFIVISVKPELVRDINSVIINRFASFKIYGMRDGSLGQRWGTLLNYPKYLKKYPLQAFVGTGSETINNVFLREFSYFVGYDTADNQYLTILVETGIIGFFMFCIALLLWFRKFFHRNDNLSVTCKLMCIMFAIQGIAYNLTSYFQFVMIVFIFFLRERNKQVEKNNQNRQL